MAEGAVAAGGQPSSEGQKPVVAPEGLIPRVVCNHGHDLGGLFVIWAEAQPAQADGGSPEGKILSVVREAEPPRPRFSLSMVDKKGYLQPVFDDKNPWHFLATEHLPHTYKFHEDTAYRFCLLRHPSARLARELTAFLNGEGTFDVEAWGGTEAWGDEPLTADLLAPVRPLKLAPLPKPPPPPPPPPQPQNARAGARRAPTPPPAPPPPPEPDDFYLEVPLEGLRTAPKDVWPRGAALYGRWTLYPDMPGARCAPVAAMVSRLQWHLAAFCYPLSEQETPFFVFPQYESPWEKGRFLGNLGLYDERTTACLMRFQENAAAGEAFHVHERALAHGELLELTDATFPVTDEARSKWKRHVPWNFLLGTPVRLPPPSEPAAAPAPADEAAPGDGAPEDAEAAPPPPPEPALPYDPAFQLRRYVPGLVDAATGAVVEHWLEQGYRKPGKLLLPVDAKSSDNVICMREDAAVQLEMWRLLVRTFGVDYGLPSGHSFRDITSIARGVAGVLNNSIHKTGMAIDFSIKSTKATGTDFTLPGADFPIRIEQRFHMASKDPVALAQAALAKARSEREAAVAARDLDAAGKREAEGLGVVPPKPAKAGATPGAQAPVAKAPPPPAKPPAPARPAREPKTGDEARKQLVTRTAADALKARGTAASSMPPVPKPPPPARPPGKAGAKAPAPAPAAPPPGPPPRQFRTQADKDASLAKWDKALAADDAHVAALDKEIALREQEAKTLSAENDKVKLAYKMRWCLYGHSSIDPGAPGALDTLASALEGFPKKLHDTLLEHFAPGLRPQASAWLKEVAFKRHAPVDRVPALAPGLRRGGVRSTEATTYFRDAINPFLPDPLEADGGTSCRNKLYVAQDLGAEVKNPDTGAVESKLTPYLRAQPAKSYVNLSQLGHLCNMLGIGTAGTKWKQGFVVLQSGKGFATIAQMILNAGDHKQARNEPVVVQRNNVDFATYSHDDLDRDFLRGWTAALKELVQVADPKRAGKLVKSNCITAAEAPRLTLKLPSAVKEDKDDAQRLVDRLKGEFKAKRFFVVSAGKRTALDHLPAKGVLTGAELADELGKQCQEFADKRKPAEMRERSQWLVTLQPVFVKAGSPTQLAEVAFHPSDRVQVAAPGEPRTLEWWHFQSLHAYGGAWEGQVEAVGLSRCMLGAPVEPPYRDGGAYDQAGLGYTAKEMGSPDGGMTMTQPPGNLWIEPPSGW